MLYSDFVRTRMNSLNTTKEAEGCPCTLFKSKGKPLKDYQIYGNSSGLASTPTPDEPIFLSSLGERARNIFDDNSIINEDYGTRNDDGSITLNSTANLNTIWTNDGYEGIISIRYSVKYLSSDLARGYSLRIFFTDGSAVNVMPLQLETSYVDVSYTTPSAKIVDYIRFNYGTRANTTTIKDIQIEKNNVPTEYRPLRYIDVTCSGNLFSGDYKGGYISGGAIKGFSDAVTNTYLLVIPCKPNTTYTISKEYATERFSVGSTNEYPYTNLQVNDIVVSHTNTSLTTTSNADAKFLVAFVYHSSVDTLPLPNVWVNEGSVGLAFIQYKEPVVTTIDLVNKDPLRKIGGALDYIDFKNSKIVRNICKYEFRGSEFISGYTDDGSGLYGYYSWNTVNSYPYAKQSHLLYCSHLPVVSGLGTGGTLGIDLNTSSGERIYFRFGVPYADIKAWMTEQYNAGTPVTVYYPTAESVNEPIVLPAISTIKNTCVLSANDAMLGATNIYAKYIK